MKLERFLGADVPPHDVGSAAALDEHGGTAWRPPTTPPSPAASPAVAQVRSPAAGSTPVGSRSARSSAMADSKSSRDSKPW
jgi:hypothetical protein